MPIRSPHQPVAGGAEAVRQWLLAELIATYCFPCGWVKDRIAFVEGVSSRFPTLAGFRGFCLLSFQGDPYLWVSVDRKGHAEKAEGQLRAVLQKSPFASVGISSDGTEEGTRVTRKTKSGACEYMSDIELFAESPAVSRRILTPLAETAENVFFEAHSHIRDIDGLHADESLDELCKILYAKLYDEEKAKPGKAHSLRRDRCGSSEEFAAVVRSVYSSATGSSAPIRLSNPAVVKVAEALEGYSLTASSIDVKGRAFQRVLGPAARAGMGQYFTPLPVIQLMVAVAAPGVSERIMDPFAGSGHFLTECLNAIRRITPRGDPRRIKAFARHQLHGIEKSDRMTRVALTDMRLHGDGQGNIRCGDALLAFENYSHIQPESFDLVLTNPPFGSLLGPEALGQLGRFELTVGRRSVPLEVLGLERCVQLLRPGGRLGIVLPDGILANRGTGYVRTWLAQNVKLRAIVSLPVETFTPFGANIKTSIVFARKWRRQETRNADQVVCMVRVDNIGYESNGRPCDGCELASVGDQIRAFLAKEGW